MKINEKIKNRRIELGMSQDELAKRVGYKNRSSINMIESGQTELRQSKILKIAEALSVSPSELMGFNDNTITPARLKALGFNEEKANKLTQKDFELISTYIKGILDSK